MSSPVLHPVRRIRFVVFAILAVVSHAAGAEATPNGETAAGDPSRQQESVRADPAGPVAADTKRKAMDHFETGLKLYEDGEFSLALIEFERAYSYIPDYRVLYNIGQVSIQLGRYARAARALQQYVTQGGASIAGSRLESVSTDLKMLQGRTAHLQVDCDVSGAEILMDDVRIATTPVSEPLLVDAGEHRLVVQKPGYVTRTERLVLAGRDEQRLQIALAELPKAAHAVERPSAVPIAPNKPTKSDTATTRTQLLYVGAGATGLFAVGWGVTGYLGIRAAGDLHDELQHPTTEGALANLKQRAQGWLLASDILGACALGVGATTLYFTLTGSSAGASRRRGGITQLNLGVAPSAVQLRGAF